MIKPSFSDWVLVLISLVGYYFLGNIIPRHQTLPLFITYAILFLSYSWITWKRSEQLVTFWIVASLAFRASLLVAIPQLSDDFYRFIWDGRLWAAGHHPFAALPHEFLDRNIPGIDPGLYDHLNSKYYFTVYPPLSQYVFWLAVTLSPDSIAGSVIAMRVVIFLFEAGSLVLIVRLLDKFQLPRNNVLIYALNPLIILELTGNLHFEAMVIFFLLLSVLLFSQKRRWGSAISLSAAICTKLLPLIFLPSFIGRLKSRELMLYFSSVLLIAVLLFLPFLQWDVLNSWRSVGLYFNKFEFNASVYYLIREIGYVLVGYNVIQYVGWKLALLVFTLIMLYVWKRNRLAPNEQENDQYLFQDWMWMLSIYFLFTTTLHPWYISTLLLLSVFTPYRFVVVWTGLIFLTYAGYTPDSFHEVLWLTMIEYLLVAAYLGYELWRRKRMLAFSEKIRHMVV